MWEDSANQRVRELKISILKKKIQLGYLIDHNAKLDRVYRWSLMGVALLSPAVAFLETTTLQNESIKTANIVISLVVAGLIKLKDWIVYDKTRDTSKAQLVKYTHLYERIERELLKPIDKRQDSDDFIYWITREFNNLDLNDPELSFSEKREFAELCRKHGIDVDEDMTQLLNLVKPVEIVVSQPNDVHRNSVNSSRDNDGRDNDDKDNDGRDSSPNPDKSDQLPASPTKQQYLDEIRNIDTAADLKYSMDRLNNL